MYSIIAFESYDQVVNSHPGHGTDYMTVFGENINTMILLIIGSCVHLLVGPRDEVGPLS